MAVGAVVMNSLWSLCYMMDCHSGCVRCRADCSMGNRSSPRHSDGTSTTATTVACITGTSDNRMATCYNGCKVAARTISTFAANIGSTVA